MFFSRHLGRMVGGWVAAGWLLAPSLAYAHGEFPGGTRPFFLDGEFVGGATTYGLVFQFDAQSRWIPSEALPREATDYVLVDAQRLLAATFIGLYVSKDWGCSWTLVEGPLAGLNVTDLAIDPDDPRHIFATTASSDVGSGVFESTDGGATWSSLAAADLGSLFKRLVVSPQGQHLTAQVRLLDVERSTIWTSADLGASWSEPTELQSGSAWKLLGRGPESGRTFIADESSSPRLFSADDELASLEPLGVFEAELINDVAELDGKIYVAVDYLEVHVAAPGGPFERVPGVPGACLERSDAGLLWACGDISEQANFLATSDGREWLPTQPFPDVCPMDCPADTPGAVLGPSEWLATQELGVGTACCELPLGFAEAPSCSDVEPESDGATRGCTVVLAPSDRTEFAPLFALALALGFGRLRERRAALRSPPTH